MYALFARRYAIPFSIFAAVLAPNPGRFARRPSLAAASSSSSDDTPSPSWIFWIFAVPSPGTRSISSNPSGVSLRSCSR